MKEYLGGSMLDKDELQFIESKLEFWDKLTETEKELAHQNMAKVSYSKGFNLHSSESECLGVLLVKTGELRAYILSEEGKEITLYRLIPGEFCLFSASCVINSITFDVHVDAEVDTEAYLLNIGAFSKLCKQNIYVENSTYKKMLERFSDVMWSMEQILFLSFDKRLAIFLLDEISKSNSLEINLTQDQIAKYVGSAREVVSRMLKVFQTDGILEQSRGTIKVINKNKLKELVR
jgi:CRP/FNR family transcriptional regulator, anaerobic regulatory protein